MKYRAKAADVDAIQVHFGTRSYPKWLEGKLTITTADELTGKGNSLVVRNGDYLVSDSGVVSIYGRSEFPIKFDRVRVRASTAQEATA